ncbi:hypothetical protein SDC9_193016 [bioreactor metagenome]|uniref:Uncharacterized protein n=1 Tax=bioreactor metagenome TaxID=1076179 RepID=A0A645I4S4_9ZZZZ
MVGIEAALISAAVGPGINPRTLTLSGDEVSLVFIAVGICKGALSGLDILGELSLVYIAQAGICHFTGTITQKIFNIADINVAV